MPSDLAPRHNRRGHTSIQGRDNNVGRALRRRLSLLGNMRDRSSPGKNCDSLRSLLPRTGLKAEEAAESLASIWFFFHSFCFLGACSFSCRRVWFLILLFASVFVLCLKGGSERVCA